MDGTLMQTWFDSERNTLKNIHMATSYIDEHTKS